VNFSITTIRDRATIHVHERIVETNKIELRELALDALDHGAKHFVVDLAQADYIDSSGLGTLVMLTKRIHEGGGDIRLRHVNADLRTLFQLTKLEGFFDGFDGGPPAA